VISDVPGNGETPTGNGKPDLRDVLLAGVNATITWLPVIAAGTALVGMAMESGLLEKLHVVAGDYMWRINALSAGLSFVASLMTYSRVLSPDMRDEHDRPGFKDPMFYTMKAYEQYSRLWTNAIGGIMNCWPLITKISYML
jgi:hypothetical protein